MNKLGLRCRKALVVFTKGRPDKYIWQSVKKGFIKVPNETQIVKDGKLFLFDDLTPLGIKLPIELEQVLKENNEPTYIVNAQKLACDLVDKLPVTEDLAVIDGGGTLAYLFLKRAGYEGQIKDFIKINRWYEFGMPFSRLSKTVKFPPRLILDDIMASGETVTKAIDSVDSKGTDCVFLMASSNISKGVGKSLRERQYSTLPDIEKVYCGQFVNGTSDGFGNKKPAILSMRYLLTKAVDDNDYVQSYLMKKFGGQKNAREILEIVKNVDREPIDLLRRDPFEFLNNFGVKVYRNAKEQMLDEFLSKKYEEDIKSRENKERWIGKALLEGK